MLDRPTDALDVAIAEPAQRWSDAELAKGFTPIPNGILFRGDLSAAAKVLYGALAHYAWKDETVAPGADALQRIVGVGEHPLRKATQELVGAGVLAVHRRGQGKPSLYVLSLGSNGDSRSDESADQDPTKRRIPPSIEDIKGKTRSTPSIPREDQPSGSVDSEVNIRDAVEDVYTYWREQRGRSRGNYDKISPARRKKIETRLREFTPEELIVAIDGVAADPWEDRHFHDDITVVFRSREQVEKFIALAETTPRKTHMTARDIHERYGSGRS